MALQDKLPKDAASLLMLRERLDKMSDAKKGEFAQSLPMLKLKSPKLGLLFGIFGLYGTDRLYKGDIWLGLAKFALTNSFFGIVVSGVWWIVDWFLVHKDIRKDNFQKVMSALESNQQNGGALSF